MKRFFVKQGLCAAICITMAFSVCAYTAVATASETSITLAAEMTSRAVESFEKSAEEKFNTARAAAMGILGSALNEYSLLKAEVTRAIIPEP